MFPITEQGSIDHELVKAFVQERLSYTLPDFIWEEVDLAFAKKWNEHLGYRGWFYWDEIIDFVYHHIVAKKMLLNYEKVEEIVSLMLTYIERNGGFLDDDGC
jgi:hypothetical protein